MDGKEFFTTRQTAEVLKVKPGNLLGHIYSGNLDPPKLKVGTAYLWTRQEICEAEEILRQHKRQPRAHWTFRAMDRLSPEELDRLGRANSPW